MKYSLYLFVFLLVSSCSSESKEAVDLNQTETQVHDSTPPVLEEEMDSSQAVTIPKVLIIPCSNGYEYNTLDGDVNPSLEEYLTMDERVSVEPFPYKKMQGAGYFGVYDKKHCANIL